ncbi:MAG: THUMP-like domain-containing protein [Rufibacter sp.]
MLTSAERKFIEDHLTADPAQLVLRAKKWPQLNVPKLAQQIQARQKAKAKIPTWAANLDLVFPANLSVEQSSSELTAAYKASLLSGETLADLTGGFGVDAFYFAQRFKRVMYVERQAELAQLVAYNHRQLAVQNVQVQNLEAEEFLDSLAEQLDVIYLDPARRGQSQERVHLLQDCEPDVLGLLPLLLQKAKHVLLKTAPMLDIDLALKELAGVSRVWVVTVQNEVKEVLYLMKANATAEPVLTAVNLRPGQDPQEITFTKAEEEQAAAVYALEPLRYLYEPNTALLKAGAFKWLSQQYRVQKLHRNSHLYTSLEHCSSFPGRIFEIVASPKANAKELHHLLPTRKANITARNYPLTVAQLRDKLKLKEGGEDYLFATTDIQNKPILLLCRKVD